MYDGYVIYLYMYIYRYIGYISYIYILHIHIKIGKSILCMIYYILSNM